MMIARLAFTLASAFAAGQSTADWRTDLSKRSIELSELKPGGPGRDGIPDFSRVKFLDLAKFKCRPLHRPKRLDARANVNARLL